jgi:hypothetical protein
MGMFIVPDKLSVVMKDVCRTFLEDCKKNYRYIIDPRINNWFKVMNPEHEKQDGIVRVNGGIVYKQCTLYVNSVSSCFEADVDGLDLLEQLFYMFINMIVMYRKLEQLPPLDTRIIDGLVVEDSPPVNSANYGEMLPENKINKLGTLINEYFINLSFTERHGSFNYFVCSNSGHSYMPQEYVPVYTALLDSFAEAFPLEKAQLFAVRWAATQRLFFVVEDGRVYCCKTGDSREFLKKNIDIIFRVLSDTPKNSPHIFSELPGRNFRFTV